MSSSTFEIKSESDTDKVTDFSLDSCEENGIMSTDEGELLKDHTYTKGPDVLEEELREILDSSSITQEVSSPEKSPPEKSRPSRSTRTSARAPAKKSPVKAAKPKKAASPKKEPVSKRGKSKKEKAPEVPEKEEETATPNGNVEEKEAESAEEATEEQSKPANSRRGRKRKIEDKENEAEEKTEEPEVEETETKSPAKRRATKAKKSPEPAQTKEKKGRKASEGVTTNHNLPKGWVKKLVTRQSGKSAGMIDVYIYSPDGIKFRSKPEVANYLTKSKSSLKIELFDFGKKLPTGSNPPATPQKKAVVTKVTKPKVSPAKMRAGTTNKGSTLLVKIGTGKSKKNATSKKSPEKPDAKPAAKSKSKKAKSGKKK